MAVRPSERKMHKRGNFFGILLAVLLFASLLALFTSEPRTTGLVVKEKFQTKKDIDVKETSCSGKIPHGECSKTKPLYCYKGDLIYNCYECGCNEGRHCGENGACEEIKKCADGSIYGECSFLNGKFCQEGKLIFYCDLCGCDKGFICSNNKCIRE